MAVPSITVALDDLYTTTWQNRQEGVGDNIFDATPFWFWMKDKGKLVPQRGGRIIEENLEYAQNSTVAWLARGGTVAMNDFKFLTVGQFNWRYLAVNVLRFWVDDQQNSGKNVILNWVKQKLDNSEQALVETLETQLAAGSGSATNAIDGLQWLVADDPTSSSNTVGGIDPSVYTWWRNQTYNFTSKSFAVYGVAQMRTTLNNCMQNRRMDAPDIILSDQSTYEYYEDTALNYLRTPNTKLADLGFANQTFKGIPMVWSPAVTGRMYFLNTRFLKFTYDPQVFFDMTEWKPIPAQGNDRAAQILTACSFTTNRRRTQGVIYNINTP